MPFFLLNILRRVSLKQIMYLGAAAVLAFFFYSAAIFIDDKYEAEAEIVRLEQQLGDYEEAVRLLKEADAQKDAAIETANAVTAELQDDAAIYNEIGRDAASAKEEDDAPVAPVLRRTLDALDGM